MQEKLNRLYISFYEHVKRILISRNARAFVKRNLVQKGILTKQEKKQAIEFYKPYLKIDPVFHAFYKEKTGEFQVENLPVDVYINRVDEYFNNRNASHVLDNKCLYSRLFPGISTLEVIASRMGGFWYDGQMNIITKQQWIKELQKEEAVFLKAATDSFGGNGVKFVEMKNLDELEAFLKIQKGDLVVQRPFIQHPSFAKLNSSSVNTLRILSLLTQEGVAFYSSFVRMGVGKTKVDNAAQGGIFCGLREDGSLKDTAYRLNGESFKSHPDNHLVFDGYKLVGYDKAKELIKKAHPLIPTFRMISWDIVIDEQGEAHMLEANFSKGGVGAYQLSNGPLFGKDTKKILDEVFGK